MLFFSYTLKTNLLTKVIFATSNFSLFAIKKDNLIESIILLSCFFPTICTSLMQLKIKIPILLQRKDIKDCFYYAIFAKISNLTTS